MDISNEAELTTLIKDIENKTCKTVQQLYDEREKRIRDAIELRIPDRIPLGINLEPYKYAGIPRSTAYYDPVPWKIATRQIALDFSPDFYHAGFASPGPALELLDIKNMMWPGGQLPPDIDYQFVEGEYMKADEYDLFLSDPTDFLIRRYLPRVYGALTPLAKLPPLGLMFGGFEGLAALFDSPEFEQLAKTISKAGREVKTFRASIGNAQEELESLGFPPFSHFGGAGGAPFDTISTSLRGMTGSMLDMYRQPDKLLQACDKILEMRIARAVPANPAVKGNPKKVGMPLWRGDKVFMSDQQFNKFYWPGLKKAMLKSIELGFVPMPFFEAEFGDRLECLLELPRGKFIASVMHMDVAPAKEILGDHCCVIGRGPMSLRTMSLHEVEEYHKHLIDISKKGGGIILHIVLPENHKTEDLQGLVNSIKEYARY